MTVTTIIILNMESPRLHFAAGFHTHASPHPPAGKMVLLLTIRRTSTAGKYWALIVLYRLRGSLSATLTLEIKSVILKLLFVI